MLLEQGIFSQYLENTVFRNWEENLGMLLEMVVGEKKLICSGGKNKPKS
jgi:hypothetical protein